MPKRPGSRSTRKSGASGQMWPIWTAISAVVVAGLLSAVGVGMTLWFAVGRPSFRAVAWDAQAQLELIRISLFVVAGVGGVVALVVAYRRQRVAEVGSRREDAKPFNERFMAANAALGDPAPAVRLGAVHAMARLADDWREQRQVCN